MQILQGPHQVQTALFVLEQAPLIETLANKTALLLDLLTWVANCPFHHFPLLQEDLDFRVSPWAKERSCRDRGARWVVYRGSHTHGPVILSRGSSLHSELTKMVSFCYQDLRNTCRRAQHPASTRLLIQRGKIPGEFLSVFSFRK